MGAELREGGEREKEREKIRDKRHKSRKMSGIKVRKEERNGKHEM